MTKSKMKIGTLLAVMLIVGIAFVLDVGTQKSMKKLFYVVKTPSCILY